MEGKITFHAQPTPTYDAFTSVTLSVGIQQTGGFGALVLHSDMATADARAYAERIVAACDIVDSERNA